MFRFFGKISDLWKRKIQISEKFHIIEEEKNLEKCQISDFWKHFRFLEKKIQIFGKMQIFGKISDIQKKSRWTIRDDNS